MSWLFVAIPAAIILGIAIYDFIEGKTLIHDLVDEWKISRVDLFEMDRAWADREDRSDIVVSLTTIPSRLPLIEETIKTLLRQSLQPASIRLNIPKYSKREKTEYIIPDHLHQLQSVEIVECDDYGPATKLIPSLLQFESDQRIVVVDDDRNYPENFLADLAAASDANSEAAFGFCGWIVPGDLVHRPANAYTIIFIKPPAPILARRIRRQHAIDVLRGVSGYLVKPRFFDLEGLLDYSGAPPAAFFVDDVWISGHCRADKFVIPAKRSNYFRRQQKNLYDQTSLGKINSSGNDMASRNNSVVTQYLADSWKVGGRQANRI